MPKYKIDIWFNQKPEKLRLGSVIVEAETEEKAHQIACDNTELWVVWQVGNQTIDG